MRFDNIAINLACLYTQRSEAVCRQCVFARCGTDPPAQREITYQGRQGRVPIIVGACDKSSLAMPDGVTKYRGRRCYGGNTEAGRLEILQLAFCLGKRIIQFDGRDIDVELGCPLSYVMTPHRRIVLYLCTAALPFVDLVNLQQPDDPQDGRRVLRQNPRDRGRCNPNILLMGARSGSVPDDYRCCG